MSRLVDEICAEVEARLSDVVAPVGFALVIWLDNRPGDPKAVCVASPPRTADQVQEALATGIAVLGRQ